MKTRICAIGVLDSIELIKKISVEFSDTADFSFYTYDNVDDIMEYMKENSQNVDVAMFTGQYPYQYFKKNSLLDIPFFAISKTNETLIETFWKMKCEGIDINRVSIDRSPRKEIIEILDTLEIPVKNIKLIGDSSEVPLDKIYEFHKQLYNNGETEAIISSNYKLYRRFKEDGYKAYRILPSRFLIRESIKKAISIARTEKIKSSQVAVQIIRIRDVDTDTKTRYKQLKLANKFDDMLIDYTQENQGSFFKFGRNDYMIFTTRGYAGISDMEGKFGFLAENAEKMDISFSMGIGYGETVTKSESNSKTALMHALEEEKNSCYIVDDDSTMTGPIFGKNSYSLSYELVSSDERIVEMSKKTGVSEKYLSKLRAISRQRGSNIFDTEELSEYLNVTQRSASRIINKLEAGKMAETVGKKSDKTKGRPKKLYKIEFE
ncbi:hypothetical protein SAMN02745751_01299 [Dethiosulfatibacter aminovorans DSM 17477]|uniref:HTH domain-containing protein n=1 Tax=Dethiosulfatibacter aminovorans DSM 17477 TaxID=1121476 RepID=A0A1M6EZU8_9FIRM|nr:hypothetical protein [Dethiosulfatibacter aminovorans]SHI90926.1 hypothetical protein SAMN02745751_01299 [Dethiosulfatibacter aminovorans DSM 17477]